ncbi:hypothetical protein M378DRAFT_76615 [Amanita muscaria Koide BX008]|uniref:Uncharacterized protein n=1 Tax=Amanita muscaria (strain Koide BX008) TaxID=946122 RepID=A0A0C2TFK7_AMAMK|nr:hypothetical protein M378DRAFT_76615 [Amanita muscaria Koide BX008]
MPYTLKRGAIALLLIFLPICHAVLVNRTIDSNLGDPVTNFQPIYHATPGSDEWDDETCTTCNITPDPAAAFDNTYMSATYFPHNQPLEGINITLQFTGVAVWVFFILSNTNVHGNPFVSTHCNFTLDGQHAGSFSHEPDNTTTAFIYNVAVFSQTGLSNTPHEVIVSVNDFPIPTWLCFDYAIYTYGTFLYNLHRAHLPVVIAGAKQIAVTPRTRHRPP